jgi:hypothetical protein
MPVMVTLPLFVTTNEYVTVCPAAVTVDGFADLTTVNAGAGGVGIVTLDGGDVGGAVLPGGVPVAVAVFDTDPESTSVWVRVYDAVQVTCASGISDAAPAGQTGADIDPDPVNAPSVGCTLVNVTLPVFVIRKL